MIKKCESKSFAPFLFAAWTTKNSVVPPAVQKFLPILEGEERHCLLANDETNKIFCTLHTQNQKHNIIDLQFQSERKEKNLLLLR